GSGGGDVAPFIGVYATTSHTRAGMPGSNVKCADSGQPVGNGAPFFQLSVDTVFIDPDVLSVRKFTGPAPTPCNETLVIRRAGGRRSGGGAQKSGAGGGCGV